MKLDAMSIVNSFPLVRDRVILLIHRNSIVYVFLQVNTITPHLFFEVVLITSLYVLREKLLLYKIQKKVDLFENNFIYEVRIYDILYRMIGYNIYATYIYPFLNLTRSS